MVTTTGGFLAIIGEIVTASYTWATKCVEFITSNPIVLMCVLFTFVGYGVHLVKMLLRR